MNGNPSFTKRLGVRIIINARARLSRLGGSLMAPGVWEAMQDAGRAYLDMGELHERAGERIAELTRNEAAYVTSGSAAGLVLTTAACITGTDPAKMDRLPHIDGLKDEIVIHRFQRNHYDINIRQTGARLVEIGNQRTTHTWELEGAIGERTAAVMYFPGRYLGANILPLEKIIEIAKGRGVPVIVDAAAQLPPAENLWAYSEMGADLVIFSGGKSLAGPQNTGLIFGRKDLVAACRMMGSPCYAIGRPMKVGREDIAGLMAALEYYLSGGEQAQVAHCEKLTEFLLERISSIAGLSAHRRFPNELGQALPEVVAELDEAALGLTREEFIRRLWEGDPRVEVGPDGDRGFYLSPDPLQEEEAEILIERIKEVLASR